MLNDVVANADEWGVDASRVAVAGSSAGGALAACLAQRCADGSLPPVALQLLHQPVLDDRGTGSKSEFDATPAFDGAAARQMWQHYLASTEPSADSVPARRDQLHGLPATFISCSDIDPLRDEALDYAVRLLRDGVATELHVVRRHLSRIRLAAARLGSRRAVVRPAGRCATASLLRLEGDQLPDGGSVGQVIHRGVDVVEGDPRGHQRLHR